MISSDKLVLRKWTLKDVPFSLRVRNNPEIMKYFRQDDYISVQDQEDFIMNDKHYNGHVIEFNDVPVGLCGVKTSGEFTLGVLPEYQHKGISTAVMQILIQAHPGLWSEVFVGNPALEWFISKLGFKVYGVKERAYYKKDYGMIDVVKIFHE